MKCKASLYSFHIDKEGEARIAFSVPQSEAMNISMLPFWTEQLLDLNINLENNNYHEETHQEDKVEETDLPSI